MAEEFINLPSTPDTTTKSNGDNLIRNSGGNSNSAGKRIPHYLRPSTGSCHDKCKYGTDHSFEKHKRTPIRKRITTTPPAPDYQNSVEIFTLEDGKRTTYVKHKQFPGSPTVTSESSRQTKREVSSPSNKLGASIKLVASNTKESTLSAKAVSTSKPKTTAVKTMSSTPSSSAASRGGRNANANSPTESNILEKCVNSATPSASRGSSNGIEGGIKIHKMTMPSPSSSGPSSGRRNNNAISTKEPNLLEKRASSVTPISAKASKGDIKKVPASPIHDVKKLSSLSPEKKTKFVPPHTHQNGTRSGKPKQPSNEIVQEKTLYVIQVEIENKTFLLPPENRIPAEVSTLVSPENQGSDGDFNLNSGHDENITCISVETRSLDVHKTLELAKIGSRSVRSISSLPLVSPKASPSVTVPLSISSQEEDSLEESEYTDTETEESITDDDETLNMDHQTDNAEGEEYKKGHRKVGHNRSHDKDGNPVKLRFRRGKVVDINSDNNGPRRLIFRRGRVLGDDQNVKGETKSRRFKKIEQVDGDGTNPESEKVMLRHQVVQDKKDAQGLFNNVIEETASKLARTRSSKVKALVGAFETVISLQDNKPT